MESPSYGPNTEEWDGAKKTSTVCNKQLQKHEQHLVHVWDTAIGVTRVRSTSKAEILNQQFQSVYTKENLTKIPNIAHSKFPSMKPLIIFTLGVTKLLKHLKQHKASGPDNIPTRFLIAVAEEIAPMLTTIFQTSLDTATVPSDWREAMITPLYKKGPRNIPANYRPVTITSVVSKLLEHIIYHETSQLPQDSYFKSTWFSLKTFLWDAADCHNTGNSQKS